MNCNLCSLMHNSAVFHFQVFTSKIYEADSAFQGQVNEEEVLNRSTRYETKIVFCPFSGIDMNICEGLCENTN